LLKHPSNIDGTVPGGFEHGGDFRLAGRWRSRQCDMASRPHHAAVWALAAA